MDISKYKSDKFGKDGIVYVDQLALLLSGCRFACQKETVNRIASIEKPAKIFEKSVWIHCFILNFRKHVDKRRKFLQIYCVLSVD